MTTKNEHYFNKVNCNDNELEECCRDNQKPYSCECGDCIFCFKMTELTSLFRYLFGAISEDRIRFSLYTSLPKVNSKEELEQIAKIAHRLEELLRPPLRSRER